MKLNMLHVLTATESLNQHLATMTNSGTYSVTCNLTYLIKFIKCLWYYKVNCMEGRKHINPKI